MNQRSHILYEQLKGFGQRMDMSVVKKDLPPKTVFVVAVKLSQLQMKLYKKFLDVHGFTKNKDAIEGMRRTNMFAGYQALAQMTNLARLDQIEVCPDVMELTESIAQRISFDGVGSLIIY